MKSLPGMVAAALVIAGVAAGPAAAQNDLPASTVLLVRFDTDKDGAVTKTEVEAGLRAEYVEADLDRNNCLNPAELRAENERRLRREGGQATPLVDWNLDGCVNMAEFGGTVRSYFTFADRNKDATISQLELRGPAMPLPYPPTVTTRDGQQQRQDPNAETVRPGVSY